MNRTFLPRTDDPWCETWGQECRTRPVFSSWPYVIMKSHSPNQMALKSGYGPSLSGSEAFIFPLQYIAFHFWTSFPTTECAGNHRAFCCAPVQGRDPSWNGLEPLDPLSGVHTAHSLDSDISFLQSYFLSTSCLTSANECWLQASGISKPVPLLSVCPPPSLTFLVCKKEMILILGP